MKKPLDEHTDEAFFTRFGLVMLLLFIATGAFGAVAFALAEKYAEPDPALTAAQVDGRTRPVAEVITSPEQLAAITPPQGSASGPPQSAEQIVAQVCDACHAQGLLNAPKTHDKAAWQTRLKSGGGMDNLVASAAKGKGAMPPRGGATQLSDEDLKKAIEVMMN
jgi:cytochrome c5